jgi:cytosine deaminase
MEPEEVKRLAGALAAAGIAVTILPATDLFLTGRGAGKLAPRGLAPGALLAANGVTVSLSSNNILNPFTPYGDGSLIRVANIFANVAQLASDPQIEAVYAMISTAASRQLGAPCAISAGQPADIVLVDAPDAVSAIRTVAPVLAGWKRGRQSFRRERAELLFPADQARASLLRKAERSSCGSPRR